MHPAAPAVDCPSGSGHLLEAEAAPAIRPRRVEEEALVKGVLVRSDAVPVEGLDAREVDPTVPAEVHCVSSEDAADSGLQSPPQDW